MTTYRRHGGLLAGSALGSLPLAAALLALWQTQPVEWWSSKYGITGAGSSFVWKGQKGNLLKPSGTNGPSKVDDGPNGRPAVWVEGNKEIQDKDGKAFIPSGASFTIAINVLRPSAGANAALVFLTGGLSIRHQMNGQVLARNNDASGLNAAASPASFTSYVVHPTLYSYDAQSDTAVLMVDGAIVATKTPVNDPVLLNVLRLAPGFWCDVIIWGRALHVTANAEAMATFYPSSAAEYLAA